MNKTSSIMITIRYRNSYYIQLVDCRDTDSQWRTQGGCTGCTCIPPPPPVHPPPWLCASPPPQPERLVMRKDEAVGNKKKMQVCLPAT